MFSYPLAGNFLTVRVLPPATQSGGVWISQELWRAIRRQLESKVQEINALVDEHQKVSAVPSFPYTLSI